MAKKILAIFFVSILLCSYIIPTTSAFADVVIGDNDSYAVTELGVENGKKIATMEAMLQLLESGVSEINFNDISDLEDYLEEFYDELTNVNYNDVSNELLAGAYNDVKELKKWIDDRGEYIATYYKDYLNSADQGLSNIFNDFQLKLPKSKLVGTSLNGIRGLSRFRDEPTPTPNPNPNYSTYIELINGKSYNYQYLQTDNWFTYYNNNVNSGFYYFIGDASQYSYLKTSRITNTSRFNNSTYSSSYVAYMSSKYAMSQVYALNILDIYINDTGNGNYLLTTSNPVANACFINNRYGGNSPCYSGTIEYDSQNLTYTFGVNTSSTSYPTISTFTFNGTLEDCFKILSMNIRNCNIYVNGDLWASVSNSVNAPTLDIDGFIKLYGNDNPIQYEFPQGTQIDYNALYTTIYNAIRDNLPLDMQTVNNNQVYYDSHDTVYSPTIYNYYGKDGDDENDWIDSILDYATIPDFNSALGTVAVLDTPFVNGITIVNAGVTDVIPSDILLILGGFFVLVLFVCIINRMSE